MYFYFFEVFNGSFIDTIRRIRENDEEIFELTKYFCFDHVCFSEN